MHTVRGGVGCVCSVECVCVCVCVLGGGEEGGCPVCGMYRVCMWCGMHVWCVVVCVSGVWWCV